MTDTMTAPSLPRLFPALPDMPALPGPADLRSMRLAGKAGKRLLLLAAAVILGAMVARAEIARQEWIPAVIEFPEDAEVVTERAIGSNLRMFSVTTEADGPALLEQWQAALEEAAYPISAGQETSIVDALEFSGPGIINAKITASQSALEGKTLMEFDATLE